MGKGIGQIHGQAANNFPADWQRFSQKLCAEAGNWLIISGD
jgi:hypothetical protein